jgi:hypothetical protein
MTTTNRRGTPATETAPRPAAGRPARHLYDAVVALHMAYQSHVGPWIAAASDKLHQAFLTGG